MNLRSYISIILINFLGVFFICNVCTGKEKISKWGESLATITIVEKDDKNNRYYYMIEYDIPESTALDHAGKKITGPIQQSAHATRKPILHQKIKIKYMRKEPLFFKFMTPIQYE